MEDERSIVFSSIYGKNSLYEHNRTGCSRKLVKSGWKHPAVQLP